MIGSISLFITLLCLGVQASNLRLKTFSSVDRISVYDELETNTYDFSIYAARGETESFQLAIRSERNASMYVTHTPFVTYNNESNVVPVRVYQAGFVWVSNATDASRVFKMPCPSDILSQGGCWVMDPLVPLTNNSNGTLIENMTCGFWIDLTVPRVTLGRDYFSTFSIVTDSTLVNVTVKLHVYENVFLPISPRLKNAIQIDIAHLYRSFRSLPMNEPRTKFMETCDYLLDNFRINPGSIYDSWGNLSAESLDRYVSPFVANVSDIVRWKEKGMNSLTIPYVPLNRTRDFVNEIRSVDPTLLTMLSFYNFDEFSGNFSNISAAFLPLRKEFPEIQTMTTAHLGNQYDPSLVKNPVPFDSDALHALGVTRVVPQTNYLPSTQNISECQDNNVEVWTYVSLQPYKPLACFRLDNPLVDVRGLFWQIFHYGFDGFLYWGLNQWSLGDFAPISIDETFPFISPSNWNVATYDDGTLPWLFGDGKLLYVGADGPIPSIRLANIRDGLDDYDYLSMLHDMDSSLASSLASRISGSTVRDLVRNSTLLREIRLEIGIALGN